MKLAFGTVIFTIVFLIALSGCTERATPLPPAPSSTPTPAQPVPRLTIAPMPTPWSTSMSIE